MIRLLLLLIALAPLGARAAPDNQLRDHPSPYLAMHGDDPVKWQVWGKAVLERARAENRPIFISSGYFACHWCHVMQRESYQSDEVAALLNENFIPVKLDRELHPALDAHLIDFVQRTRGSAGWPLNVFLTPEGYPLVGLTYAPRDRFVRILQRLKLIWGQKANELTTTARLASIDASSAQAVAPAEREMEPGLLHDRLVSMALSLGDDMEGGFGQQSRFPMSPQWSVLLERLAASDNERLRALVELTLDQMARNGMRDHIGGGFFRYTVDPGWQTPHYEKMLYTQALLSRLYLQAAAVLHRPDYREVARDTLDFSLRVMRLRNGGFIASLSAVDADDVEGGGYLWTGRQLEQALNPQQLAFARRRWRLQGPVTAGGGYLPMQGASPAELAGGQAENPERLRALEQQVKQRLMAARAGRAHPRDEKQLAAWNGLMLSALADGYRILGEARYRSAGSALRDFLVGQLWDGEELLRARGSAGPLGSAALEDYVYVAVGLRDWGVLTGSQQDLDLSRKLASEAWRLFYRAGGWQASDDLLIPGVARESAITDGPLPSPAALLITLSLQDGEPSMRSLALEALRLGYERALGEPVWYATQVAATIDAALVIDRQGQSAGGRLE